jgi:quercetin dioxygenase-like cupin family protein
MNTPTLNDAAPFISTREEVPSYWMVDSLWSMLATPETTGGDLSVLDQVMPRRSGPPPHVHDRLHEFFYLLDGEIRFQLGGEIRTASTGSFISIPAGTVHGFAVVSDTSRVLNMYTPAGFVEQISALGTPASELRLPTKEEQVTVTRDNYSAYLMRSAELNTQRGVYPHEEQRDMLADIRDPFRP